jgi:hypothetical protein
MSHQDRLFSRVARFLPALIASGALLQHFGGDLEAMPRFLGRGKADGSITLTSASARNHDSGDFRAICRQAVRDLGAWHMTPQDRLFKDLASFLPALTMPQALKEYFDGNREAMTRFLRAAKANGSIVITTDFVRHHENSALPILRIARGEPLPSASKIAYAAAKRWCDFVEPVMVIRATGRLVASYGGEPRISLSAQVSHDIGLSQVFCHHRHLDRDFEWQLVSSKPGAGALADAIAGDLAIELLGRYGSSQVAAKLQLAASANLELW